jgi:hypothetical protein
VIHANLKKIRPGKKPFAISDIFKNTKSAAYRVMTKPKCRYLTSNLFPPETFQPETLSQSYQTTETANYVKTSIVVLLNSYFFGFSVPLDLNPNDTYTGSIDLLKSALEYSIREEHHPSNTNHISHEISLFGEVSLDVEESDPEFLEDAYLFT